MDGNSYDDDSLEVAEKSWKRVIDAASKTGYREGIEEGSQAVLQEDFNQGYEDGFKAAFELGKFKGVAKAFSKDFKHPENITEILEKTRRGACHICTLSSEKSENVEETSTDFLDKHRKHVSETIKILREYFEPLMKEKGVDISQFKSEYR